MANIISEWVDSFLDRLRVVDDALGGSDGERRKALKDAYPRAQAQEKKPKTRFDYTQGPMHFLGQQIVKRMGEAGYPSTIFYTYRSPELQAELYAKGRTTKGPKVTKAKPFESSHQYYAACDIVHASLYWQSPPEYWDTLARVVRVVAEEYGCPLDHGHHWRFTDSAHIEVEAWRFFKAQVGKTTPTQGELDMWFEALLPKVWAQYVGSAAYQKRRS